MAWMIADYHPVSFFSLRPALTTASGGQTLLVPTAFAIKMALLRASIQMSGLDEARRRFHQIRDMQLALCLPDQVVALKTSVSVLRPFEAKNPATKENDIAQHRSKKRYPFQSIPVYREFVQFGQPTKPPLENLVQIACSLGDGAIAGWLSKSLVAINYLGKRGGFLQAMGHPSVISDLESPFFEITRDSSAFPIDGTLQLLDDWSASMTFQHADVYDPLPIRLGEERVLRRVVLPYRHRQSGEGYSLYERIPN